MIEPESLGTGSRLRPKGDPVWKEDSVGETPTDATGTVALPRKPLMIGVIEECNNLNARLMNYWNHHAAPGFIVRGLLAIAVLGGPAALCGAANPSDMVVWYRQPASAWLQAMPLGNGMIGAMVFGGVPQERIAL
ncbi:MAG: glycoside hydrolase N-terminal domain-containing protein, partial [Verrucomicrobiota bacterium]